MAFDDCLTTTMLADAFVAHLIKGADAGVLNGLDVQSVVTGVIVGGAVALLGAWGNYRAGARRDSARRNFEWNIQQKRWKQEDRTRYQTERIEAYRDMHKASAFEGLGLYYDPFSNTYEFDPRQAANGIDTIALCHSEILLLTYANRVREAAGMVHSEAFVLRTKLLTRYNKGKGLLGNLMPGSSRRRGTIEGLWIDQQIGPLTQARYEFVQAVREEQGMEDWPSF